MVNYEEIGASIGKLVKEKQEAYGDSFGRSGEVLRQLYPNGIPPEKYEFLLTIARILDKLFRIATKPDAFDEDPFVDIAGYALLAVGKDRQKMDQILSDEIDELMEPE